MDRARLARHPNSIRTQLPDGLLGKSPEQVFGTFHRHLKVLLNRTITQAPLLRTDVKGIGCALEFRQGRETRCVPVGRSDIYFLSIAQTLRAELVGDDLYRLRTLAYAYRITDGPTFKHKWLTRWEYNPLGQTAPYPRHHIHVPFEIEWNRRKLSFEDLHLPSGWITIEEVIRFLIQELEVTPESSDWDAILKESEQSFRQWTARTA